MYQQKAQTSNGDDANFPKKRKRELVTADFSQEQEQEMVDWLQAPEQECLLNKKHSNYIKKGLKDALWEQKAWEMNKTSDELRKWYANMRSRFGKLVSSTPDPSNTELTARDRWILNQFQFLKPHLVVQVKKRVTNSMRKAAALAEEARAAHSECESEPTGEHHAAPDVDTYFSSMSRANDDTDLSTNNIDHLQGHLLNNLSHTEKSPLDRQKDSFADFMKEVTYTFPLPMWLRFQNEVNSLLQKYQLELHQTPCMQVAKCEGSYPPANNSVPGNR